MQRRPFQPAAVTVAGFFVHGGLGNGSLEYEAESCGDRVLWQRLSWQMQAIGIQIDTAKYRRQAQ